ncbi:MAG: hypothetical protein A2664_01540 [Candidatus Taylorbacteria bacterium RIFCSPHIGHO2_01_FULL_46_22b]|uniref:Metallo-beta-lactamase domain-containing protein n=1 Tax=Candidatus Taylorbacteria bacterium RIFCSPHIGHO2_01_FULL_46_22b TaxID=1802301 RepID=A0A1G2M2L7_9BACT|nr:MAG: hypothetical protein A2664_01540 [Candidatus Taylorbacteria bacterium RIFCSPHIGHO2_01_FULL_46_22b]
MFIWYVLFNEDRQGMLQVAFLNVGQGDSTFIDSPAGHQMLIDAGRDNTVLQRLSNVMPFYDRTIDVVLATHPDQDHIAGLVSVLSRYKVAYVIMTEATASTATFQALVRAVEKSGATLIHPRRGMVIDLGGGVGFRILFPDRSMAGITDTNLTSIVGKVEYGSDSFLLTGDSPIAIEQYELFLDPDVLSSDVLKAGHHGSRTSSAPEFVAAVQPAFAVISAGKDNSYGHPHKEVTDIFNKFGAKILRTDTEGTIVFKTDGTNLSFILKK